MTKNQKLSSKIPKFPKVHNSRNLVDISKRSQDMIFYRWFKDTDMEKAPSKETPALTKSANRGIGVVSTTNQLFI